MLRQKMLIDPKSVKFHYSLDEGNNYEEQKMNLVEPNGDRNNSGKYSITLNDSPQCRIK